MRSELLNGGAYSRTAFAAINKTLTAAGSGDNTEVDCAYADRILDAAAEGGMAMSAKLVITYTANLSSDQSLRFAVQIQEDADGAGAGTDYETGVPMTTVATADQSGGQTITGTVEVDIDLSHAERFFRAQITPDLTAGGTDTCEWSATYVLYGHNRVPASRAIASVGSPT
jgi:hypothetical protein